MSTPVAPISARTPRLVLRALTGQDRAAFVRAQEISRDFWAPWSPAPEDDSPEALFDRQLERTARGLETGKDLRLAAFLDDGRLAALLGLNEIVRGAFQNAYAGWRVSADVTRQGIGTEALSALLDVAFAPPPAGAGLHRVQANIIPHNLPSLRLAEKVGFRREGLARAYLQIAGAWRDHVMFAKVAEEHGGGEEGRGGDRGRGRGTTPVRSREGDGVMGNRIVHHYELDVYRKGFEAAMRVFELSHSFPKVESYALTDQVRRSSRSVCANLSEAWRKRRYEAAFVSKLSDSETEAAETQVWLEFAVRCGYVTTDAGKELFATYNEIIAMLVHMMHHPEDWLLP